MGLFFRTITVRDGERAFLRKDGVLTDILGPGRHAIVHRRREAEVVNVRRTECPVDVYRHLATTRPELAARNFTFVSTGPSEVAIVLLDGRPKDLLPPLYSDAYWSVETEVTIRIFDVRASNGRVDPDVRPLLKSFINGSRLVTETDVQDHEVGLLYRNGVLDEILGPGRHTYWTALDDIRVVRLDMRSQTVEITAQEILTRDRVQVRVTAALFYRIVDPRTAVSAAVDLQTNLYRLVQFALREAVATRTLDDLVSARDELSREVRAAVEARMGDFGISIADLGVKDVILPGEVRDLLIKVIDAERTAKANLIRRQEETAATRSLLNTARLMEDNPVLLRLKELETLERLVEKVGKIDLHASAGTGLDALLEGLVRRTDPRSLAPPAAAKQGS